MKVANNHRVINMAKHFSPRPIFLITFLIASSLLTSARDVLPRDISLVKEPDENYYIVKKSPVVIVCQAKNAAEIIFNCMGTQIPPTSVEVTDVSDIDPELTQAEIEVSRADLQNNEDSFWCECSAVDVDGQVAVTSRKATISIAHLKNKFETQPKSATSTMGDEVEFECGAPEGEPKAEIMWRKDKKRLEVENNPRFVVTEKGSLLIQFVMPEDKGYYQCVARNVAGRRESEEALLSVTALAESAEPDLEIIGGVNAGKKSAGGAKLRATRQSNKTFFTTEPQEKYFITKEKPLIIDCGVVGADVLTFRCNGKRMHRDRQTINQGLDATNKRAIQSQIQITYDEVQEFMTQASGDGQTYQCVCVAWYQDTGVPNSWGRIDSRATHGFVHLAYLDKFFQAEPSDVIAGLDTDATLACEPPRGQPSPWVYWYKDNTRLDPRSSQKYSVNDKGHLTVHNVQYEDAGAYNCQAENSIDTVKSRIGALTVTAEAVITTTAAPSEDDIPAFPDVIPTSPVFLRDLEEVNVIGSDGTKTLVCAVVSAEQVTIDCDGQRIPAEEYELKQSLHRESGKRLLHVKTVITAQKLASNPSDYFCQCIAWFLNEKQAWERRTGTKGYLRLAEVEVAEFIEDEFKVVPKDTDAYFESEAQLSCEPPEGNPPPQVYWIKDGERIDTEADANFVQNEGVLFIEYVRETDEGEYICVAENAAGIRESQPIQFTVLGKPAPPTDITPTEVTQPEVVDTDTDTEMETTTISEEDSSESDHQETVFYEDLEDEYYIVDDEEVTLHCAVFNIRTLVFVCNNVTLRETLPTGHSITHPVTMDTIRSNHLTITKDRFDEYNGTKPYTCLCRAVVHTDGGLKTFDSSPATIQVAYIEEEFPVQPEDTEVISMGLLELQCQAPEAVPKAGISWLKDGQQVITDNRTRIEDSGTLVIENFREDDEGAYKCVANNTFDVRTSNEAFVSFSVTGGPDEQVTQFYTIPEFETDEPESEPETTTSESGKPSYELRYVSKDLHSVYYWLKNKPLTITCEIYNVDYITFICGDKKVDILKTRKREDEHLVQTVEASIVVPREDYEKVQNGSEYYCQCFGHYPVPGIKEDQKIASVLGSVEYAFLRKIFQRQPQNQTVMQGESLTIHCDPPVGNPAPTVSLTKDGENIEDIITNPTGVMYIIPEVQLDDAGEYICIAENIAGKRMSLPGYVEVKAKEDIPPMKPESEESVDGEAKRNSETSVHESDRDAESSLDITEVIESNFEEEAELAMDKSTEMPGGDSKGNMKKNNSAIGRSEQHGQEEETHVNGIIDESEYEMGEIGGNRVESEHTEKSNKGDNIKVTQDGLDGNDETENQDKSNNVVDSYERQDEISVKSEEKRGSLEEIPKMTTQEENASINGNERRNSIERNGCAQMLSSCLDIISHNDPERCKAVPSYTACLDNYYQQCAGIINAVSMEAVKSAQMDTEKECMSKSACQKLEECRTITSNSPDLSVGHAGLSIQSLCSQTSSFVDCVDQNLAECNVTLSPPEEYVRGSLADVDAWFTEFCDTVWDNKKELESCEDVNKCALRLDQVAHDNSTYWCNQINSLLKCTLSATDSCNLENVEIHLRQLRTQANEQYCKDHEITLEPQPEVSPSTDESVSSEAIPEPTTTEEATEEATDDGDEENVDRGNSENMEGGPAGKDTVGDADDDDDRDFGNNQDNDWEDVESVEETTTMRGKAEDKFNNRVDVYEEIESNSEEYFNEKYDNNPSMKKEDPYDEKEKTSKPIKNSEDDDYVYKDDIHETFTDNVEDSVNHEKDEDEEQGDSRASIVEASQEDPGSGSPVLRTSMFLATFLQLLILASLSWR